MDDIAPLSYPPDEDDDTGLRLVWDPTTHTMQSVSDSESDVDRTHNFLSGGDEELLDPAKDTMLPQNPLAEGILATRAVEQLKEEEGIEPEEWDGSYPNVPDVISPFPERQPHRNLRDKDTSFPTKISADLDECPECGGKMVDGIDERSCVNCNTKQPIINLVSKESMAFLAPLVEALPELGGAAAEGGAGAAEGGGIGSMMSKALEGGAPGMPGSGGKNPLKEFNSPMDEAAKSPITAGSTGDGSTADFYADEQDLGHDAVPDGTETQGYSESHGDSPELFRDVSSEGRSSMDIDPDRYNESLRRSFAFTNVDTTPIELEVEESVDPEVAKRTLEHCKPLVEFYKDSEEAGKDNPVLKALDEFLEKAFPGYKDGPSDLDDVFADAEKDKADEPKEDKGDKEDSKESDDESEDSGTKEASMIHEARKPKTCPYHADLIDYSLEIGDPAKALSALPPNGYGEAWCKSQGFEGKCNFKPAMTTQKYWDDAAKAAEDRKLERERLLEVEQPTAEQDLDFIPADTAEDFTESPSEPVSAPEAPAAVVEAPSAPEALPVAAAAKAEAKVAEILDASGQPLKVGSEYFMQSPVYEKPDRIRVESVDPKSITYVNHTGALSYRDQLTEQQVHADKLVFKPVEHKSSSLKTASLSALDIHDLIHEGESDGRRARNLNKLSLEGSHYAEDPELMRDLFGSKQEDQIANTFLW